MQRTTFGSQNWSGGPFLAAKTGLGGPLLAAKTGRGGGTSFGCQKWSPRTNFGRQKWSGGLVLGGTNFGVTGALLLGKRLDEEVMDKIRCCMELLGWWKWQKELIIWVEG